MITFDIPFTGSATAWPTFTAQTVAGPEAPFSVTNISQTKIQLDFSDALVNGPWSFTGVPTGPTFAPPLLTPQSGVITNAP